MRGFLKIGLRRWNSFPLERKGRSGCTVFGINHFPDNQTSSCSWNKVERLLVILIGWRQVCGIFFTSFKYLSQMASVDYHFYLICKNKLTQQLQWPRLAAENDPIFKVITSYCPYQSHISTDCCILRTTHPTILLLESLPLPSFPPSISCNLENDPGEMISFSPPWLGLL